MKFTAVIMLMSLPLLSACKTSWYWYENHPEKQIAIIDGHEISVIPNGINQFDAWGGLDGTDTNQVVTKRRQIAAVEQVSKCKVAESEYLNGGNVLQTVVNCPHKK